MHTFAYTRVSTANQTADNQLIELGAAGYEPDAVYTDVISGKVPAFERPEFAKLIDATSRTRPPKRLVVSKLDRLGRDAVDVQATVRQLADHACAVRVLQLGDFDLISSAGKLVLATLSAVAEMERDLLVERTQAGLARAKAEGKALGRPRLVSSEAAASIRQQLSEGKSVSHLAREHQVSRATIIRVRERAGE